MKVPRHRCRLSVLADYHQFYISDPKLSRQHAPENWSNDDISNRAKVEPGLVAICPVRNVRVPVEVGIWDSEPHVIFGAWQHVIEAPLETTGLIEVEGCLDQTNAHFSVEPGNYTVRGLFRGLDTLSEDGLEGNDFYEIQIWKSPCNGLRVIRQWIENDQKL